MNTYKHLSLMLCLAVVTSLSTAIVAEVGVIRQQGTDIVVTGPYLVSIIEDPEPTGIWMRHTQHSSASVVLNESGGTNGDGRPSMASDPNYGLPIVTWGKNNGSGFDIVESHFENGAWTTPVIIAASVTTSIDPEPSIALDAQTGAVHIVYSMGDATPKVMHTEAPADLASWMPPVQISAIGEDALRPSAVIHLGTLTVAYESYGLGIGSTPRQIAVATSDGLGGFTYDTIGTTFGEEPNRPQLHTGMGVSLWIDWIDDTNDMAWATWQPATGWGSVQIESFTDVEDRDYHARGRVKRLATQ